MKNSTLILLTVVGMAAHAGPTNVEGSLEQMKTNVENSKQNFEQYKRNMDISSQNVVETTKAVKELREQRDQLLKNGQNVEKNKAALDAMKMQIQGFKAAEIQKLKTEEAQMNELRALLQKLETNQQQRQQNIEAYETKLTEIDREKAGWDQQRQAMGEIKQEIDLKEKEAMAERAKWLEKKNGYRDEAAKWQQQHKVADHTYTKYKRLND